jgi:succinyl-CoA synthetase alpha subunit
MMPVMMDSDTRLLVQGITGHQGRFHTKAMLDFGTRVVAGVTPGKEGEEVHGVPVYETVKEALREQRPDTSIVFVPARYTKGAVLEAIDAGIKTVIVITEHVPVHDSMHIIHYGRMKGTRVVGPNCPGVASPGSCKVGIMPNHIFLRGKVGVISRSGTLTYEVVNSLTERGIGQSTCVGIGGDTIIGTGFIDVLGMFEEDDSTESIVLIGEIGGTAEEEAARFIMEGVSKPVCAYVAGLTAPPGKRMGHAGAIISRGMGTARSKINSLQMAGVRVAISPTMIADLVGI